MMHTAIVIPCFNEETHIGDAARSLGFGISPGTGPANTTLILVDNQSNDGTLSKAHAIQHSSPHDSVEVLVERERGYIPPRHHGIMAAKALADRLKKPYTELLLLQCDADTIYDVGYVSAMIEQAETSGTNILIEGSPRASDAFVKAFPGFQRLVLAIENEMLPLCGPEESEIIIDDKVSGFSLASYLAWGGHRREYNSRGDEIHAETSRLYMRGLLMHAGRVRVSAAIAQPSRRKLLDNPIRQFSTAGFPREDSWWSSWESCYSGPRTLIEFENESLRPQLARAVATRRAHIFVLFGVLPTLFRRAIVPSEAQVAPPLVEAFLTEIPEVNAQILTGDLGPVFEVVFDLLDKWIDRFMKIET